MGAILALHLHELLARVMLTSRSRVRSMRHRADARHEGLTKLADPLLNVFKLLLIRRHRERKLEAYAAFGVNAFCRFHGHRIT